MVRETLVYSTTKQMEFKPLITFIHISAFEEKDRAWDFSYTINLKMSFPLSSTQMTVKEQQEWKIPPCISNWKNAKVIKLS